MSKLLSFKAELAALLRKHGARIGFACGENDDLHALTDERIEVRFINGGAYTLANSFNVDANDLGAWYVGDRGSYEIRTYYGDEFICESTYTSQESFDKAIEALQNDNQSVVLQD